MYTSFLLGLNLENNLLASHQTSLYKNYFAQCGVSWTAFQPILLETRQWSLCIGIRVWLYAAFSNISVGDKKWASHIVPKWRIKSWYFSWEAVWAIWTKCSACLSFVSCNGLTNKWWNLLGPYLFVVAISFADLKNSIP